MLSGTTAQSIAERFYDTDLMAVMEGVERPARGIREFLPRIQETLDALGPNPQVSVRLCDPVLESGPVAGEFIEAVFRASTPGAEELKLRALMAWKRGPQGWRVALKMYGTGTM